MIIKGKTNTPYVNLDKENCVLRIIGKSYPDHPDLFYDPILAEINKCKTGLGNSKITIKLALEILNSVSTKYLYHIIKDLYDSTKETKVTWYYENDDESMHEEGLCFKSSFPFMDFSLVGVDDLRKM
jgi:hypothetical protein